MTVATEQPSRAAAHIPEAASSPNQVALSRASAIHTSSTASHIKKSRKAKKERKCTAVEVCEDAQGTAVMNPPKKTTASSSAPSSSSSSSSSSSAAAAAAQGRLLFQRLAQDMTNGLTN